MLSMVVLVVGWVAATPLTLRHPPVVQRLGFALIEQASARSRLQPMGLGSKTKAEPMRVVFLIKDAYSQSIFPDFQFPLSL
jgi:hypothetical protein